jgi:hypothetical protein
MSVTVAPHKDHYIRTHEPVYRFQFYSFPPNNIVANHNDLGVTIANGKTNAVLSFGANATLDATRTWMLGIESFSVTFASVVGTPNWGVVLRVGGIGSRGTRSNFTSVDYAAAAPMFATAGTVYYDGCSAYFPIFASKNANGATINLLTNTFTNRTIGERITNMNFLNQTIEFEILSATTLVPFSNVQTFSVGMVVYEYKSD